jgi:hypothetical protein
MCQGEWDFFLFQLWDYAVKVVDSNIAAKSRIDVMACYDTA